MRETTSIIKPEIYKALNRIKAEYPSLISDFSFFYKKRLSTNKPLLRPFLARIVYELSGRTDWIKHKELFALIEILNISSYQSNIAFDGKAGIDSNDSRNGQLISSIFSKTQALLMLFDYGKYDVDTRLAISSEMLVSIEKTYYGQFLDLYALNYSTFVHIDDDIGFRDVYFDRCANLGGGLLQLCISLPVIVADDKLLDIKEILLDFALDLGTAGQMLNDLGDFSTGGSTYSLDRYSDLHNKRLTLPVREIILLAKQHKQLSEESLLSLASDPLMYMQLKRSVKKYVEPLKNSIYLTLKKLEEKGKNIDYFLILSNILNESRFLKG